ncbi:MAG: hypothetical protein WC942_02870 [Clostridia bacterium]|jgi:hypothetical protein
MKVSIKITNGKKIVAQLGHYKKDMTTRSAVQALTRAAKTVEREAVKELPYIPFDLGNLQASLFITNINGPAKSNDLAVFTGKKAEEMTSRHTRIIEEMTAKCKANKNPMVILGHTANYAVVVHEMGIDPPREINWSKKGSGPKWLEIAVNNKRADITRIMKKELKGGKGQKQIV